MSKIHDYDPSKGSAFQGDVAIVPVPSGIEIATDDEIRPIDGNLILQYGEITGHNHKIILDPISGRSANFARTGETLTADPMVLILSARKARTLVRIGNARPPVGTARMFRDRQAAQAMVAAKVLARADLCVGFLKVEGAPVVLRHDEHDGIRLPVGAFYVGGQVESVGAEEQRVAD